MTKTYSYILIGDDRGRNFTNSNKDNQNKLLLAGLYLWSTAFSRLGKQGDIDTYWRGVDLEEYDIVHCNYTPSNLQAPTVISEELADSSTKLVVNIDIDVKQWSPNFAYYINAMKRDLEAADVLFHVEPNGAQVLEHLLGRKVHVNPHPVDVSRIYDFIKKEREPMVGAIFHRYTGETLMQYISTKNLYLRRVLFGYTPIGKQPMVANCEMYDQILMYQDYELHIEELAKSAFGIDLYSGYSYGRAVVEMAALGIPAVVSSSIDASHRLFPDTMVEPFDTRSAEQKFKIMLENPEFTEEVIKNAHAACKYYSLENSYKRFIEMLEHEE